MVFYQNGTESNGHTAKLLLRNSLLPLLEQRFRTYGYIKTSTSAFQDYDLYTSVTGTVPKNEMIKTIDPSGEVLVLRPDVTIPIAQQAAFSDKSHRRQFYVQDVYRLSSEKNRHEELTQAGVECFGENTHENDAELIAMAAHLLNDLQFSQHRIVISHAGFFKELLDQLPLSPEQTEQLQAMIQSKNMAEIKPFLSNLPINRELAEAVETIPMLYGRPEEVITKASDISLNDAMQQTISNLNTVLDVLKAYGVRDTVVFDLGLINDMDYYSGVIFQGYVAGSSKPVLMGGRYNHLTEQFGKRMAAIGFGCFADYLLEALEKDGQPPKMERPVQVAIYYDDHSTSHALATAGKLRDDGLKVITLPVAHTSEMEPPSLGTVSMTTDHNVLNHGNKHSEFRTADELANLLQLEMRGD
ncbi:ATP phosphoribosyltransferase regulatory subunit [Lentibacillus halophilus]|uniref:ATP phosphoribosyltransferase regulatory subunit n=1 Tax=Lentibacillus halophilus TaxID=295065 RepID=A0ABP3IXM8_9BACI